MHEDGPATGGARLKVWQAVSVVVFGFLLAQILGVIAGGIGLVVLIVSGGRESLSDIDALAQSSVVLIPAALVTGVMQAAIALAAPAVARLPVRETLGLRAAPIAAFVVAPIGLLSLSPVSDAMMALMVKIAPNLTFGALDQLGKFAAGLPLLISLPLLAIGPGVSEELLFRGVLQRSIRRPVTAVIVSAIAFSCIHIDPHHVAAVLPLAFYLAWVAARTGSTWVTITAHIANNAASVLLARMGGADASTTQLPWWTLPIGLAVCAVCTAILILVTRPPPAAAEPVSAPSAP